MKKLIFFMSLILSLSSFAQCPILFENTGLCAELKWIDGPYLDTTSQFEVRFWEYGDDDKELISPSFDVDIYAWMIMDNGHSHGGPKMTYQEIEEGLFEVLDARFFMGRMKGYWEVRIDLKDSTELIDRNAVRVRF